MKRASILFLLAILFCIPSFAANATPVTVNSIAVAGSTVTVTTASAHGLAANQGFCLSNPGNVCSAVSTVPNSTTFTFAQPSNVTVAVCASSCGTSAPAPRVIVLDVSQPSAAQMNVHYLLWLTTTSGIGGGSTSWRSVAASAGPTTAQSAAVAAGNFIEVNLTNSFPSTLTSAQLQTYMQNDYSTRQAALASNTQPAAYYGVIYDGSGWGQQ